MRLCKKLVFLMFALGLTACPDTNVVRLEVASCTTEFTETGYKLMCPGMATIEINNGIDGTNGTNGTNGLDGATVTTTNLLAGSVCPAGGIIITVIYNQLLGQNNDTRVICNGVNGQSPSVLKGLMCDAYDTREADRKKDLFDIIKLGTRKFSLVIDQLDTPNSPSNLGYAKFTPAQQNLVGLTDYALDCTTFVNIPESAEYTISITSDDGAMVYFNNNLNATIDNGGLTAPRTRRFTGLFLKGQNKLNVTYFQGPHSQIALTLKWSSAKIPNQVIPNSSLFVGGY